MDNPFVSKVVPGAEETASNGMLDDATDFLSAAASMAGQARHAQQTGNNVWLGKLQKLGETLLMHLIEFTKKAITLAAVKLVLELCAMTIKKLMEFVSEKFTYNMDITTPGVAYMPRGTVINGGASQSSAAASSSSPFDLSSFARSGPMSYM